MCCLAGGSTRPTQCPRQPRSPARQQRWPGVLGNLRQRAKRGIPRLLGAAAQSSDSSTALRWRRCRAWRRLRRAEARRAGSRRPRTSMQLSTGPDLGVDRARIQSPLQRRLAPRTGRRAFAWRLPLGAEPDGAHETRIVRRRRRTMQPGRRHSLTANIVRWRADAKAAASARRRRRGATVRAR
jgi:hypothetical protein